MIPPVDSIRVKNMLNSTISMSYPDVVIACIEHKVSLEAFRAIEAALVKHDNNMKDYSVLTDHHNLQSFKLFSLWQSQHAVCHCQESGKTATQLLQCPRNSEFTISSCSEGRTRDVHSSSLLIDVYALFSDVSLRRQASMTQAEKFLDPFCSRAMLICSIIWLGKRMLRVVVLRVLFFVDMRLPGIQCRWFVLPEVVFTLSWCRSINTIPAS